HLSALFASLTDIQSVSVEGHTDWRNSDSYNLALSKARADQVAAIVRQLVPDTVAISAVGLGEADARQNSPTDAEMAGDRRVDLFIVATFPPGTSC
ncbi:MAG: rane protein, partial [Aeromicrobium sp.]|nr:rane protein [Aeromicrobium sp.]